MASYSDYPEAVSNNAKRGIELNEKVGNKCATDVGKRRGRDLSQKKSGKRGHNKENVLVFIQGRSVL